MSKNKSVSAAALALLWSIDSPADVDLELSKSVAPLIPHRPAGRVHGARPQYP